MPVGLSMNLSRIIYIMAKNVAIVGLYVICIYFSSQYMTTCGCVNVCHADLEWEVHLTRTKKVIIVHTICGAVEVIVLV